jgi:SRSO17 transposase
MKKLALSLLPAMVLAKSFIISDIPLPRIYVQNLDPYECNQQCLKEYLDKDMIFSFLAHINTKITDKELTEAKNMNMAILNMGSFKSNTTLKIAMLLPSKKIGKYASTTTNASFAYLINKNNPFILKSYNIQSENLEDIQNTIQQIKLDGFSYIIAPLTKKGIQNVININPTIHIYFPTLNKKDTNTTSPYLTFGGIDYKAQSDLLLKEATSPLIIFSDKSSIGQELANYQKESFLHPKNNPLTFEYDEEHLSAFGEDPTEEEPTKKVIKYSISRRTTNLEYYLKDNEKIINGSFFINTPIIKSGMIMSQLTLYDTNATNILSTQINYDPLLLSMTQYVDRKHMIVANSLTTNNNVLIETNSLLDNDIVYDWINYSTTVGIDYFAHLITGEAREYDIPLENNQMIYNIELLQPSLSRFILYKKED